jgi:hypothetical protein
MSALRAAVCASISLLLCGEVTGDCGATLPGATRTIDGAQYTVVFKTVPDPIKVGAHFALDFAVCPRAAAPAPTAVRVDANMPLHRHGMNYRPVVTAKSNAVFRAEGLLFHMPGRWDLTFDVDAAGRTERLTSTLELE